jgi:selenocysteine lyase/cysteine desulfurase
LGDNGSSDRSSEQAMQNDFVASNGVYLLSHSVGRPLASSREHLAQGFFAPWEEGAGDPWGSWMASLSGFQAALARLLGGAAQCFCPQTNLSSALGKILFALPKRAGRQKILLSEHDFPSLGYVAQQACKLGYELAFIPATLDHTDPQVWADAMRDCVQWVLITQVQSNTGVQVPVADILPIARQHGVISVVDVAQSVGLLPIDVAKWDAGFVIGSCVKWLCGGPGAGFMWVNPELIEACQPLDVGWFSHENPFEFDIHQFRYHPTALRFWGGTPSVMPYVVAAHSIHYFARLGPAQVRSHNLALTTYLIDNIDPRHLMSPQAVQSRSGTVIVHFGAQQDAVIEQLTRSAIRFDARAFGIRLSPHIYNRPDDIDAVLAAVRDAI